MKAILSRRGRVGSLRALWWVAVFLAVFANVSFASRVLAIYPPNASNAAFLVSMAVGYTLLLWAIFSIFCFRYTLKPLLTLLFLISAGAACFMDRYDTLLDPGMVMNMTETDPREVFGLISVSFVLYILLLGVLPSLLLWRTTIVYRPFRREVGARIATVAGCLVFIALMLWGFSDHYSSFFREHKESRYDANPAGWLVASVEAVKGQLKMHPKIVKALGLDAHIPSTDTTRELIVFVVGETTRSGRFSLNGYEKKTNPLLEKEEVYSFRDVWSCGTSTRISVPCMFSNIGDENFETGAAKAIENATDVLEHSGASVLWRDNNSSSKGVADRVEYQSFLTAKTNPICDPECRDVGMLSGLQAWVDAHPKGDILIVLHQMGSHGPGYYQRYPKAYEKFTPACHTNELKDCSPEEISNAYDNTILYTDYFLSKVIGFLKRNDAKFETGMLFVGDHGESLGENGIYLHGMPMMLAPDVQRHVPAIVWLGEHYDDIDRKRLSARLRRHYTHENVFHTLLGLFEIESAVYDPKKDMLRGE